MSCLYIDADNVSYKIMSKLNEYVYKNDDINNFIIKKIYGDWSKPELKSWGEQVLKYGLEAIQCFRINKKQSTDIKLITDLMNDIYTNNNIEKIYLITSDSDFTHVCQIIKKMSIKLIVISPQNTILKTYANDFYDLGNYYEAYYELDDTTLLKYFIDTMENNYILLLSKFKRQLKQILPHKIRKSIKLKDVETLLKAWPEDFFIKKIKKKIYIILINDILKYTKEEIYDDKEYFLNKYKEIFHIIKFKTFINDIFSQTYIYEK